MPVVTGNPTVLERLNEAAAALTEARVKVRDAAKVLYHESVPVTVHRDVLFVMDTLDDRVNDLAEVAGMLDTEPDPLTARVRDLHRVKRAAETVRRVDVEGDLPALGDARRAMDQAIRSIAGDVDGLAGMPEDRR